MKLGGIEAGGTKTVFGVGDETGRLLEIRSVPTTRPDETVPAIVEYFRAQQVEAVGVGSFGPVQVDPGQPDYGTILNTPKTAWRGFDWLRALAVLGCPVVIDTDVNAAVFGEAVYGVAAGLSDCVYVTVGTGIGGGVLAGGKLIHGQLHPEVGHMLVRRHPDDSFAGVCPFHGDCLEGLASGPAIEERWGCKGSDLDVSHPAWTIQADYLAQMAVNLALVLSTKRVILGGGVMHQQQLYDRVRDKAREYLAGYIDVPGLTEVDGSFIAPPGLGDLSGLSGALALAAQSLRGASR